MSRIQSTFEHLKQQGRKALIPYVMAGFPEAGITPALMHALAGAGADVIELGVPFSDPNAELALAGGTGLAQVLEMVKTFRQQDGQTPVVLMGYANPVERYDQRRGAGAFIRDAAAAGVDGLLIVDYPPEECADFAAALKSTGLDLIFLLAPTSTDERMAQVARLASGYVYYVSLKGVTGAASLDVAQVEAAVPRIRRHVHVPVGVGFGIRDAETARAIGSVADAVVIGSRLIQLVESAAPDNRLQAAAGFMREIRAALDGIEPQPTQRA